MINIAANPPRVERVDDLPVIYGLLERMGMGAIIDDVVKAHGNWQGLSPGQVLTVWLMHSISEQNHKLEPVQQWAGGRRYLLESLLGSAVSEFDFTEERLAMGLRDLSQTSAWAALEERLGQRLLGIYDLPNETLRLDATVGSVYHAAEQGTLLAVGKAKKGHYAKQFKVMMASLAPLGLPVVVDVERGNQADDPLYVPSYQRAKTLLQRDGLLVVGDSKMSARTTRGTIATSHDYDLVRLADKKDEPALLSQLLEEWRSEESPSLPIFLPEDWPSDGSTPDPALAIASAVEVTRQQEAVVAGARVTWAERLLVVRADSYLQRSLASLHGRLEQAECALLALTPPRQRGKGQMQSESALCAAIARLEQHYAVLTYRHQIVQENIFRRWHGKVLALTPLYVQREDHARGLVHLLTSAARLLALGDSLARQALAATQSELAGVYAGNAQRSTPRPTTQRMLKAFEGITLLIASQGGQRSTCLLAFLPVPAQLLALLGLAPALLAELQVT